MYHPDSTAEHLLGFNSMLVRLKVSKADLLARLQKGFNSMLVRLKVKEQDG